MQIHLSDGSFFSLPDELHAREGIGVGTTIAPERIESLKARAEVIRARSSALRLIARSPHTRRKLAEKLRARSFGESAVRAAVARMKELGYLDDRSFAESWTRSRLSARTRFEGWRALYRGLMRNGVPRAIAEETLSSMFSEEEEKVRAARCVAGLSRSAAIRRLTSRGFRSRTIARVLREMGSADREGKAE